MNIKSFLLSVVALGIASVASAQTQVVAHRGYWKSEGAAQNSVAALRAAAAINVYGSEFDVQLTADKEIVVNHDADYQGHVIAKTKLADLRKLQLANGEPLPTLEEYLKAGKQLPQLKMVLEIKEQVDKSDEDLMVDKVVAMIKAMRMEKQTDYISFSMRACERLARLAPDASVSYLGGKLSPAELKAKGVNGMDYHYNEFKKNPQWVSEAHALGMTVNVWTVDDMNVARQMRDLKVDFITTNRPLEAAEIVK